MLLSTTAMITSSSLLLSLSPGTLLNSKARVILSNKLNLVNFLKLIQSSILDYKAKLLTKSTKSLSNVSSHQLVFIHDFTFPAFFSFSSFTQSCPILCDPIDCSMSGFPVHHWLPELAQTYVQSWWCHSSISSSVIPFFSCLQSFPASGSFLMSQFFESGGQILELQLQLLLFAGPQTSGMLLTLGICSGYSLGLNRYPTIHSCGRSFSFFAQMSPQWSPP